MLSKNNQQIMVKKCFVKADIFGFYNYSYLSDIIYILESSYHISSHRSFRKKDWQGEMPVLVFLF